MDHAGSSAYHASKGAVRLLTNATAIQHAKDGIRCNSVHPGFIDTPMAEASIRSAGEIRRDRETTTPHGQAGHFPGHRLRSAFPGL